MLADEYPDFGGRYEVMHHTEFINWLIKEGRLKLGTAVEQTITYHDPCYIGRYNDIYDAPREILQAIPGVNVVEMKRTRSNALCCGAGGGRMWLEERVGRRMNQNRIGDVQATGAGTLAAACPFCTSMFTDGIKGVGAENEIKLLDLAELVQASMVRNGGIAVMDGPAGGGTAANTVGDVDTTPPTPTPASAAMMAFRFMSPVSPSVVAIFSSSWVLSSTRFSKFSRAVCSAVVCSMLVSRVINSVK